jgi:hypothetical protein
MQRRTCADSGCTATETRHVDAGCAGTTGLEIENGVVTNTNVNHTLNASIVCIPNSRDGVNVISIAAAAFQNNTYIRSVRIGRNVATLSASMFIFCTNFSNFTVADDNPNFTSQDGVLYDKAINTLVLMPTGRTGNFNIPNNVTIIGPRSFEGSNLTSVTIPNSVTTISVMAFAFAEASLTNITIPSSVITMNGNVFAGWTNEQTIYVQGHSSAPAGWATGWDANSSAIVLWNQ